MRGVWKIATIAGIPVQVHWSFSFLLLWVYYEGDRNGLAWDGILVFAGLMLALFACVVLHEFGHALAARRFGVGTKDITLSPIGGIARLNRLPEKPIQEFIVAIAGPLVNVVIALVLGTALWLFAPSVMPEYANGTAEIFSKRSNFFPLLFLLNIALVVFNLLPAFPMDGGRMLRSLLSIRLGRLKATRIASLIGRIIAVMLFVFAIYKTDIVLGLISLFVFVMAAQEYYAVRLEDLMSNKTIRDVVITPFTRLMTNAPMQSAFEAFDNGEEKNFLVFNDYGILSGTLREREIVVARKQGGDQKPISQFITPVYGVALANEKIKAVYERMRNPAHQVLPVYEDNKLIGLLDLNRLNKYLRLSKRK